MKDVLKNRDRRNSGFSAVEVMVVVTVLVIVTGLAIPILSNVLSNLRTAGDAQNLNSMILLAKMRAAADFARSRVYIDFGTNSYHVELYPSNGSAWTQEGGTQYLSNNVSFGYSSLTSPPTGMSSLAQAPLCLQGLVATSTIANTACIMFNSRGIPVDSTWSATSNDAIYVTNGSSVTGVTISPTGLTRIWRSPASSAVWIQR